jgi:hypothetical protein
MLTDKCPYCGSFNDVTAAECYFCHKELPDVPGQPKKNRHQKRPSQNVTFSSPASPLKRKSPPGCLVIFSGLLILFSVLVAFQWINGEYHLIQLKIPAFPTDTGAYISYYLNSFLGFINTILQYPVPVVVTIGIFLILCWGLLNLKKWSRTWALILLTILIFANFALFANVVIHFYAIPERNVTFCLILVGILLNAYCLLWFFEHKKTFD